MKWVRTKAKRLSLLALFALAIQLGLSFGHLHADPAWSKSRAQTIVSSSSSSHSGLQPDADDVCEICVTIAMVSTAMHSAPPMLPLPAKWTPTAFATSQFAVSLPVRLAAFQSRGPPLS
jgi:hypothetical protein